VCVPEHRLAVDFWFCFLYNYLLIVVYALAFSALMLLVGGQEGHLAYKKLYIHRDVHISQGSVATYLRCGGMFKFQFVAILC